MGAALSRVYDSIREIYPPKSAFSVDDIPDLTGKVALVTGGNSGLGKLTCKYLLMHDAKVYMACRSRQKAEEAIVELKSLTGKENLHFLELDLSDLVSVKKAANEFRDSGERLDMLFNNAGILFPPLDQLTKQGYDGTVGTNFIGHAYLTMCLLPVLISSATSAPEGKVRVINVSSNAHALAPKGGVRWDMLTDGPGRRSMKNSGAMYYEAKWANIAFSNELARRYGDQGIVSTALNPGGTRTNVSYQSPPLAQFIMHHIVMGEADPNGVLTQLYAGTHPDALSAGGKYFMPWARLGSPRADTGDVNIARRLWEYVEEAGKKID